MPFLMEGLKRLEYRGYDSAGLALLDDKVTVVKAKGKIENLRQKLTPQLTQHAGIGHTRWATHGKPSEINAHPHTSQDGKVALIHNGIIENYSTLRQELLQLGYKMQSETDTEVLAHLIQKCYTGDLEMAVREVLGLVTGAYGIAVVHQDEPGRIVVAKMGSPLIIGLGEKENYLASDRSALIGYTQNVVILEDGEMAVIEPDEVRFSTIGAGQFQPMVTELMDEVERIDKGDFPHFMLKEIFEQPRTISDSFAGRLLPEEGTTKLGGLDGVIDRLLECNRLVLTACGTSWHAALVGEYMLEEYLRIPVEVEYASEFRYRNP
ncbi:MAG: isomerizing glutamine--fructose-6-phosphate transaminase, partial [Candidatus Cloacimonetes bacterium]|nr:isomerizing glutamine--fructose-6-phosphate transaminase [Candidatus Cloacimonadota bacterium]